VSRRFSRTYESFSSWRSAQPSRTKYVAGIERRHARYPSATLGQLRRHPRAGQPQLSAVRRAPPYRVPLAHLSPRERVQRQRALSVVSESRRGKGSLTKLARAERISPRTVRRATGTFRKKGGRWVPTKSDRIQRWLKSYEDGRRVEVLIDDSRTATLLSKYAHAVSQYLVTRDPELFRPFRGKTYKDAFWIEHTFETRPETVLAAVERSESDFGAFVDLYAETEGAEETA
jgi:hypothetical protein